MVEITSEARAPARTAPYVFGDIEPYQAVGPEYGRVISSRSHHREYLKRHNLTEVGNERKYFILPDKSDGK
jgi:hypothetical protein